jgi:DNA-binding winged helix-turn-helix (wHTH) protein/tetratricopeptide (TPR) repeat protein
METKPSARVVRFGVFELDPGSGELRRNGLKVRLPEQSFQVLRLLLSRPGEIVTRDELRHALWTSDTYVDFDGGLNSAVRKLREALDDSAENPRFVVTLPRRGYRFVAPIEVLATNQAAGAVVAAPAHDAAHPQRSLVGGLLVAGTVAIVGVGHGDPSATRRSETAGTSSVVAASPHANPGVNEKAYAAYLNGVEAMGLQKHEGFTRAVAYLEEAVTLQPDFTEGHAALALAQLQLLFGGPLSPREVVPKAEAAARRALELDETVAQAHRVLGQILLLYYWDREQAEREHQRAADLDAAAGRPRQALPAPLIGSGNLAASIGRAEQARDHDPLSFPAQMSVGTAYRAAGQHDRAIAEFRRALEMVPGQTRAHFQIGGTYVDMGLLDEAIPELEASVSGKSGNVRFEAYLGYAYAAAGRTADAQKVLARLEELRRRQYVSSFGIALIYDALGEKEPALLALERAFRDRAVELSQMNQYPRFNSIVSDSRYAAVMTGVRP